MISFAYISKLDGKPVSINETFFTEDGKIIWNRYATLNEQIHGEMILFVDD